MNNREAINQKWREDRAARIAKSEASYEAYKAARAEETK